MDNGLGKYVDGYTPDRCWFRNGYVTRKMIDVLSKEVLQGGVELGTEQIVSILDYIGATDQDDNYDAIRNKIVSRVSEVERKLNEGRGVQMSHDIENFFMTLVGWDDYCIAMGIISSGDSIKISCSEFNGMLDFSIERLQYDAGSVTGVNAFMSSAIGKMTGE